MTQRVGFFTDTSICIGCKACEVACKEWNGVPEDGLNFLATSYDNTGGLGADTWRHVAFIERPLGGSARRKYPGPAFRCVPHAAGEAGHGRGRRPATMSQVAAFTSWMWTLGSRASGNRSLAASPLESPFQPQW